MSFSTDVKQELSQINNLADKKQVKYELLGYLTTYNTHIVNIKTIRYATESDYNINRFSKLLDNLKIEHKIEMEGNLFVITFKFEKIGEIQTKEKSIIINLDLFFENIKEEYIKSFIRGAFLGSGSITNPETAYHLEINFNSKETANLIEELLKKSNIEVKRLFQKNKQSIYIKEGEEISKILALMGASKAVLSFEDIRIKKEMRGKVNRLVNCETANLTKIINASVEQINAIKKLKENGKFSKLNDNLKEIANLRLKYPDLSYEELGNKLAKPVGKSGVNYRLKKIIEIAQEG